MYTPLHDWTVSLFSPVLLWSTQKFSVTLCLLPLLPNFVQFCILRKCFAVSCSVASVWCLCACGENHNDMVQKGLINNSCNQWAARVSDLKVTGYHSQNLAGNLRGWLCLCNCSFEVAHRISLCTFVSCLSTYPLCFAALAELMHTTLKHQVWHHAEQQPQDYAILWSYEIRRQD